MMQADPQLKAALAARLNSHAETSGHSSGSNGGSQQEGPSAEERRSNQKRAREECSEPPAPIRVDVSDSGSTQAFYSASRNNYEVSIASRSGVDQQGIEFTLVDSCHRTPLLGLS